MADSLKGFGLSQFNGLQGFQDHRLLIQRRSLRNHMILLSSCKACIRQKGIYGLKYSQESDVETCTTSITSPDYNKFIHLTFPTSKVICSYYPNHTLNLIYSERNIEEEINYCSQFQHTIPTNDRNVIIQYEVIGLPVRFKVDFYNSDPVCGGKIGIHQIGHVLTLKKPSYLKIPCVLILPGKSSLKILDFKLNYEKCNSTIKLRDGRSYNKNYIKEERICNESLIFEGGRNESVFDISCSQGEIIINTETPTEDSQIIIESESITFILTNLPENDNNLLNTFTC
uniref:CUB domain-containing protein n=1 Tax=Parastrongyloides trichosuri TaxID=131310 RepID=A0A0N4Z051_PARTI